MTLDRKHLLVVGRTGSVQSARILHVTRRRNVFAGIQSIATISFGTRTVGQSVGTVPYAEGVRGTVNSAT